jgi:methylmalonyl-CoA mutase cobalamin-binding domain/chain
MAALRAAGANDVQVVIGGIVPPGDEVRLLESGVARVFHPGTSLQEIADTIRALAARARALQEETPP